MKLLAATLATLVAFTPVALLGFAPGCLPGPEDGNGSSSSGGSSGASTDGGEGGTVTRAGQACLDFANAYAHAGARCGDTYESARQSFIAQLANGDCNSVAIRNEAELRNGCLHTFSSISCTNLREGRFPPACAEQIIRQK